MVAVWFVGVSGWYSYSIAICWLREGVVSTEFTECRVLSRVSSESCDSDSVFFRHVCPVCTAVYSDLDRVSQTCELDQLGVVFCRAGSVTMSSACRGPFLVRLTWSWVYFETSRC